MPGSPAAAWRHRVAIGVCAVIVLASMPWTRAHDMATSGTLSRIRDAGRIKFGYRVDARPFSYKNDSGQAAGYSAALCLKVADGVKADLHLPNLSVEWVPVGLEDRFRAVQQGQIDLLCGADTTTLRRRGDVSFSIPIFPGGIGALTRADAPIRLRNVLAGRGQTFHPSWRASAAQALQSKAFTAVAGTTTEQWLSDRVKELQVIADVSTVSSYAAGISQLLDRRSDVLFGERAILIDAARHHPAARDLAVVERLFTYEPLAFAVARGDEDFRLAVDRALSRFYRSGGITGVYTDAFGEPDENVITFFRWNALPE
jgi:ABC-type amino acid transport substrate-binding protein